MKVCVTKIFPVFFAAMRNLFCLVCGGVAFCAAKDPEPLRGPYDVKVKNFKYAAMDSSAHDIAVYYPSGGGVAPGQQFPLISYAHGDDGGGLVAQAGYAPLLKAMAAFGYVIALPKACNSGCHDDTSTLPHDPRGFGHFFVQQLRVFDFAREQAAAGDAVFASVNASAGVGIAGHSMGGQATVFSGADAGNVSRYDIRAAVMHHAYTHTYPPVTVPHLVFTGSSDHTAPPSMATGIFDAPGASAHRGLVNKKGATHYEPITPLLLQYNPLLAQFSAAWMKVHLDGTPQADGNDYDAMIYGAGSDSLCGGGDGDQVTCTIERGQHA